VGQFSAFNILIIRVADGVSHKFFHQLCCIESWDKLLGQFGTMLMLDFQLVAIEIWALSQKFFHQLCYSLVGQLGGTVWDNADA
jgi:hypothetical protein